ncbi:(2Fe-2S)-binding protein [Salsuginibacillus kocurii]|uniref:(2Fe-2S)-binding protein n=1 Tax=Salsuginibacillus kocurii TaxID=427078 RepID=UPI00036EF1D0|nr:(2Fe-2S)-binding protein [Salsuginibacillus kocurii]
MDRINHHPILGERPKKEAVTFTFDNTTYVGEEGDTVAVALLSNDIRTLRHHEESGSARGIYCNIGHCFECRVTVNDIEGCRACLTVIEDNMKVESGKRLPNPLKQGGSFDE